MSDENTNKSSVSGAKTDPKLIKKLEADLKTAFKENRFSDIQKIADELKKADAGNHLAERILEKVESVRLASLKVATAAKIKLFEQHMQDAFKSGRLMDLAKIANEIKKLDPENKAVKKIEGRIDKAKADLDAQVKKERIRGLEIVIKDNLKEAKLDEAIKKANELLVLDQKNGTALKALQKAAKEKKVDYKNLMTPASSDSKTKIVEPPKAVAVQEKKVEAVAPSVKKEEVKAPGFFSKLFKKKDVKPAVKPVIGPVAQQVKPAVMPVKTTVDIKPSVAEIPKAVMPVAQVSKTSVITDKKPGFFSKLFKKKDVKPAVKPVIGPVAQQVKPAVMPVKTTVDIKPSVAEIPKAVMPVAQTQKATAVNPENNKPEAVTPSVKKEEDKKSSLFSNLFKKQEVKPVIVQSEVSKKEALSKAISAIMGQSAPVEKVKPAILPVKAVTEIKPAVIEPPKAVTPVVPEVQDPKPSIFKPIIPVKAPVIAFKPEAAKTEPAAQAAETIVTVPLTPVQNPLYAVTAKTPVSAENKDIKGNIFTKLFGEKAVVTKPTESIIETIVTQSSQSSQIKREARKQEESTGDSFLKFSGLFLKFSVAFIIISAGFFYSYNIDTNNTVFSLIGQDNYAIQLKSAATTLDERKAEKEKLDKEVDKYKKGYENDYKGTIDKIIKNRMDWPNLIKKLNEVTESVYEKNALAQYVQYNNYSYEVDTGKLTVSATLSDPLGKNLTKLAELEEAFMYYPKDKNDSNDTTKPYFYGLQGFRSYAKSFNKATGRYMSSFSLSISTKPEVKKK